MSNSIIQEIEFSFELENMNVVIMSPETHYTILLDPKTMKKLSLYYTEKGIIVKNKKDGFLKEFDYNKTARLVDYLIAYFSGNKKLHIINSIFQEYIDKKDFSKNAYISLLQNIKTLGYLNSLGMDVLNGLLKNDIKYNNEEKVVLHKILGAVFNFESRQEWCLLFNKGNIF